MEQPFGFENLEVFNLLSFFFSVQLLAWQAALRAKIQNHYSANQKLTNIHII